MDVTNRWCAEESEMSGHFAAESNTNGHVYKLGVSLSVYQKAVR
jgi:hypothetical protein